MSFEISSQLLMEQTAVLGITTDSNGNIYYTTGNKGLWKFVSNQHILLMEMREFALAGVAWNEKKNNLYMINILGDNSNRNSILQFSFQTRMISSLQKELNIQTDFITPRGITVDKNGNLVIPDKQSVKIIDLETGTVQTIAGISSSRSPFKQLSGVVLSDSGTIYVTDVDCIHKIQNGEVSIVAGRNPSEKDVPTHQSFEKPCGLTFYSDGNLIIADSTSLRKVTLSSQTVSTVSDIGAYSVHYDKKIGLLVGTRRGLYRLLHYWDVMRLFWIARLKEHEKECQLAVLPKDIIHEIVGILFPKHPRSKKRIREEDTKFPPSVTRKII